MEFKRIISGFIFVTVIGGAFVTEAGKELKGVRRRMAEAHALEAESAAAIQPNEISALYRQAHADGNKPLQIELFTEWERALMAKIEKIRRGRPLKNLNDGEVVSIQKYAQRLAHLAVRVKELGQGELAEIYAGNARREAVNLSKVNNILKKANL